MNPRIREALILALVALAVVIAVIGLILLIFQISGHQDLLVQMLESTAEGELFGIGFTAGGPFGMWIIAFLLLKYCMKGAVLGVFELVLRFPQSTSPPPTTPSDFKKTKCHYLIFSNGRKLREKSATIQSHNLFDGSYIPFLYVKVPRIEKTEVQVFLEYKGKEWISSSYSPQKGNIDCHEAQ